LSHILLIGSILSITALSYAQSPESKPQALRLPDGTVIFLTKSPDDPAVPPDSVMLTAKEYQALLSSQEQLRKLSDLSKKLIQPTKCQAAIRVESRGTRSVALIKLSLSFQTTSDKSLVAVGGAKAYAVAAKQSDGSTPFLSSREEGLAVLVEKPGQHSVEVDFEAPVAMRGLKGEVGFEVGLPRAAITTLNWQQPTGISKSTLILRSLDRPGEAQSQTLQSNTTDFPLGAAENLSLVWTPQIVQATQVAPSPIADAEITVRVDELVIESLATVVIKGPAKEYQLQTPPGSEVSIVASSAKSDTSPKLSTETWLVRPSDTTKAIWLFRPTEGVDWTLQVTSRVQRPRNMDPKYVGPYSIGPISVLNATRQTGTMKIFAPRNVALRFNKLTQELRPQDLPPEEELRTVYRFSNTVISGSRPLSAPWLELEARAVPSIQRVQPTYTLSRVEGGATSGWRVQSALRITPPSGGEVSEFIIDVPRDWQGEEFGPLELITGTIEGVETETTKQRIIQLQSPQKVPFDLSLTALAIAPLSKGQSAINLAKFPKSLERDTQLNVNVPEGLLLRGTAVDASSLSALIPVSAAAGLRSGIARTLQAASEKGLTKVDLNWQPYRSDLSVEQRAEVTLQARQITVEQTLRLRTSEGDLKPFRLRGPDGAAGWNLSANVDILAPGEWLVRPPAESKDWTMTLSFALPIGKSDSNLVPLGLAWVELATRTESTLRIWNGGYPKRISGYVGPWRELPPEAIPERPSFPWLTLAASGSRIPLSLESTETNDTVLTNQIERTLIQAVLNDDGAIAIRSRFLLKRWSPVGIDIEVPANCHADILIDGKRFDPSVIAESTETRLLRVASSLVSRRNTLLLEVMLTAGSRMPEFGKFILAPPKISAALFRTQPRWVILSHSNTVPLLTALDFYPDVRWSWQGRWPTPASAMNNNELEQWLIGTAEADRSDGPVVEGLLGRQSQLQPVQLLLVPRTWWVAANSFVSFLLLIGLSRLRRKILSVALIGFPLVIVFGLFVVPQQTSWFLLGTGLGIISASLLLTFEWLLQWYYLRRITHLPGFRRVATTEESQTGTSLNGARSSRARDGSGSQPSARTGG
jgi:hypothetical protein